MEDNNQAAYYFHEGTNFSSEKYLGAHKTGENTYVFRTWAPRAETVELVGDFNSWGNSDANNYFFQKITEKGLWELETKLFTCENFFYKFKITNKGNSHLKSDPYAFYSETEGKTASIFWEFGEFNWGDGEWIKEREKLTLSASSSSLPIPLNIYEVHLGSFYKKENGQFLSYREYADVLARYVKKMGFTHVELMPIAEHPYGGSWGYQISAYFAPTSRYGTPDDFKYFINKMHECGIGVILDWVPGHFPKDEAGLYEFDGEKCYEYQGEWKSDHKSWGTRCFDVGRPEVQSFLISNALFWLEEYHIDALRMDAVASMLYLDYDRKDGEWVPNTNGDNRNLEAIAFFKKLNSAIHQKHPHVITIAEESTEWENVTRKENDFGLGFDLKWNMGWMHDTLDYCSMNPFFRKDSHNKLTFSFFYAFSERFVLAISHDEVVHGKKSLVDKFFGDYEDKFATFRTFYSYMIAHPGKKMLFMSCEIAQFSEWNYENSVEWFMTDFEKHSGIQTFVSEINHFYLKNSELWEIDFSWDGFRWIVSDDNEQNIIVFERFNKNRDSIICAFNFSPVARYNYRVGVENEGVFCEVFSTNELRYSADGIKKCEKIVSEKIKAGNFENSISLTLPAFSGTFIKRENTIISFE